jgi:uncharacterized protein
MAKRKKVPGWHSMKKDELVKALLRQVRIEPGRRLKTQERAVKPDGSVLKNGSGPKNGNASKNINNTLSLLKPKSAQHLDLIKNKLSESKDLAFRSIGDETESSKDRLVVMVRDPYWLHVYWELTRKSIERAKVALGQHWHGSRPILRLSEVLRDGIAVSTRQTIRDVEIHGGVNNWYIDVQQPPKSYQIDIGYLTVGGRFFSLARSNVVTTPNVNSSDTFDKNWTEVAKEFDRIFVLSGGYSEPEANGELKEVIEERIRRPVGETHSQFGACVESLSGHSSDFDFQVDTELIVHGVARPDAHVTLRGEPVKLRSDGTFAVRFNLPDRRHVLPVVASSRDGAQQRTIVLAVDRNTKVMEPVVRDASDES